ncbi:MAG: rhomboid family intramembrane serine protease [Lachnospiraceae bacterium]|nr:rhomboid family intramembrane serine protease [Lachnospiraceae bacterium]
MKNNIERIGYVTIVLIISNVTLFLAVAVQERLFGGSALFSRGMMYAPPVVNKGEWYRLLSCCFLHFDISHLMNNMIMLGAVGQYVERHLKGVRYLLLYLLAGIGGNAVSLCLDIRTGDATISAGASGAVFGIVGALLAIAVKNGGKIDGLGMKGILLMIALSLFAGFTASGINNAAHVGGLLTGMLLGMVLAPPARRDG